ncbi:hypothetical protein AVEN_38760-1 [Araneus ventricosus]|uniref:Uncharacterized protein n=1 Tax=Araneus ventricosus TaxID=182803 RepID=A0A4Y2JBJ1_ARAVE|nr:hypothetical protein AVEN_38760-1 [Araneus ventricosus]
MTYAFKRVRLSALDLAFDASKISVGQCEPGNARGRKHFIGIFLSIIRMFFNIRMVYSATARVQLAGKAFGVAGIEPNNAVIISENFYSPSLATLAPLDNDCTVAVAPEENEDSSSTSQIDVSIQSILPLPRHEQRGTKRKRKYQKSEIMTSSPLKDFLEKKEKVELEEVKANREFKKNKNGDQTKKKKSPENKEKNLF